MLIAATAAPAAAQGIVLDKASAPVPVARIRALLVFQEFGGLAAPPAAAADNREDLLVEIELAGPAPEGAVWVLSAPGRASCRPAAAGALDELSGRWREWRAAAGGAGPSPAPWPLSASEPAPKAISGPMELAALADLLKGRKIELPAAASSAAARQSSEGWSFFLAEVPAGATRLSAHLAFKSAVAFYPGALGAEGSIGPMGPIELIKLPPLELMILHPHFVNVDDNTAGLGPRLGLGKVYQDPGTLQDGGQLWADPAKSRPGQVRDSAERLGSVAGFVAAAAPDGRFFLTVVAGSPHSAEPSGLDCSIPSHYPSAVEPLPAGRSLLVLAALLLLVVLLAGWLLRRKEISL